MDPYIASALLRLMAVCQMSIEKGAQDEVLRGQRMAQGKQMPEDGQPAKASDEVIPPPDLDAEGQGPA